MNDKPQYIYQAYQHQPPTVKQAMDGSEVTEFISRLTLKYDKVEEKRQLGIATVRHLVGIFDIVELESWLSQFAKSEEETRNLVIDIHDFVREIKKRDEENSQSLQKTGDDTETIGWSSAEEVTEGINRPDETVPPQNNPRVDNQAGANTQAYQPAPQPIPRKEEILVNGTSQHDLLRKND